ncbi:MAG TPA: hypothetical protein ENI56_00800 [Candidatus Kaiserbacteria bacterium]|mgnify:CR=1 FL=1|nr:hypothetical protein [Candidatus Kaiserbacteria bacterium]
MNSREKLLNQEQSPVLDEKDIKELMRSRNILHEDCHLIEELSECPKSLFLEFHNFFSSKKEGLVRALEYILENLDNEKAERKNFLELYLELAKKYNWTTCWNINVVFERRKAT